MTDQPHVAVAAIVLSIFRADVEMALSIFTEKKMPSEALKTLQDPLTSNRHQTEHYCSIYDVAVSCSS